MFKLFLYGYRYQIRSAKETCTTSKQGRVLERTIYESYTERNKNRVKKYPEVYKLRQQIIEHIFGTWKRHMGMDYTLVRGKAHVETEYRLGAICYNLMRVVRTRLGRTKK